MHFGVVQPTPLEWLAMTLELSRPLFPSVLTLMSLERRCRLGEAQSANPYMPAFHAFLPHTYACLLVSTESKPDVLRAMCSATWFQRGQQVRTQASARLDHRATVWGT